MSTCLSTIVPIMYLLLQLQSLFGRFDFRANKGYWNKKYEFWISELRKHFIWDTLYVLGQVRKVIICSNLILTAHISSTSRVRYCVLGPYSSWVWKKNEWKGILAMAMAKYCFAWLAKGFRKGPNVCDVYYIFDCNIVWKTLKEGKGKAKWFDGLGVERWVL